MSVAGISMQRIFAFAIVGGIATPSFSNHVTPPAGTNERLERHHLATATPASFRNDAGHYRCELLFHQIARIPRVANTAPISTDVPRLLSVKTLPPGLAPFSNTVTFLCPSCLSV